MTIKFKFDSNFGLPHFSIFFLTIEMTMTFTFCTLNQFLQLFLVGIPMEFTVIGFTMTVNWRYSCQWIFICNTWIIFALMDILNFQVNVHISQNILIQRLVGLSNWSHFWWNNFTLIISTRTLELLIKTWFTYRVVQALNFVINFNNLITWSTSFIWILKMLSSICLNSISSLVIWVLHQIIWFEAARLLTGHVHSLWNHVSVVLINRVVLVTIGVNINLIQLMINLWFKILLYHIPPFFSSKLLS